MLTIWNAPVVIATTKWILVTVALSLVSCSEHSTNNTTDNHRGASSNAIATIPPTTYDSIGLFHNQVMQHISTTEGFDNQLTEEQGVSAIVNWFINHSYDDNLTSSDSVESHDKIKSVIAWLDSLEALGRTAGITYYNASSTVIQYVDSLLWICDHVQSSSYAVTIARIEALKSAALNDNNLSDSDEMYVLAGLVTASHSFSFWWEHENVDQKIGSERSTAEAKVAKILEGDAKGAIIGAIGGFVGGGIIGGIFGSLGGPAGTLGGAAGGAVVGSLRSGLVGGVSGSLKAWLGW